jgi:hypothetical protein
MDSLEFSITWPLTVISVLSLGFLITFVLVSYIVIKLNRIINPDCPRFYSLPKETHLNRPERPKSMRIMRRFE